jgi:prevent-host-death family protein
MATTYTVTEARAHLGEVVNKAQYANEVIELTQHGRTAAVVISTEMLAYFRQLEDEHDVAEADRILASGITPIPHAEVAARFGLTPEGHPE